MTDEQKNEFLGMAVHELRTPVHKISLASEVLLSNLLGEDKRQEFLEIIHRTSMGMVDLINDLLDISRIRSGNMSLSGENVVLAPLLTEVCQDMLLLAEQKEITITWTIDEGLTELYADRRRLVQVLDNLLSNALKFSNPGTSVSVRVSSENGVAKFAVCDEGPGISAEDQKSLFQPFQRSAVEPTGGEPSTGLGLAICRTIVDLHGGTIGVDSTPGSGATFFFTVPQNLDSATLASS